MFEPLPSAIIAAISFAGRTSGQVKQLAGFRKAQHSVPDAVNSATQAFFARLCAGELGDSAERLFQEVRAAFGYKRKDLTLSVAAPSAVLSARDFTVDLTYGLEPSDPSRYTVTTTLREACDLDVLRGDACRQVFAGRFTDIEFALTKPAKVESVIDAIEALDGDGGLQVTYPSDYRHCTICVEGVEAEVRCEPAALGMVFPRGGNPAELIDAFVAVRAAFQISKELRGLIEN